MKFINRVTIIGVPIIVLLMAFFLSWYYAYGTQATMVATVTHTERACDGGQNGDCRWLVLTDKMSFENRDSFFHWKYNSTDVQGKLSVGETYKFEYYGWRIHRMSVYPNIIRVSL